MRKLTSGVLLLMLPGGLSAQTAPTTQPVQTAQTGQTTETAAAQPMPPVETPSAGVIYATGTVYVNGAALSNSSSLMPGDVVQSKDDGAANISAAGSSVVVDSNSIVRARGDGFALDRGSVSVATGKGLSVYARDFKITPLTSAWTQYYVTRSSGTIGIIARKNAVTVTCGTKTATVKEGEQLSREDAASCGLGAEAGQGAPPAAQGPILASPKAQWIALGAAAALATYGLAHDDDPVSPAVP